MFVMFSMGVSQFVWTLLLWTDALTYTDFSILHLAELPLSCREPCQCTNPQSKTTRHRHSTHVALRTDTHTHTRSFTFVLGWGQWVRLSYLFAFPVVCFLGVFGGGYYMISQPPGTVLAGGKKTSSYELDKSKRQHKQERMPSCCLEPRTGDIITSQPISYFTSATLIASAYCIQHRHFFLFITAFIMNISMLLSVASFPLLRSRLCSVHWSHKHTLTLRWRHSCGLGGFYFFADC